MLWKKVAERAAFATGNFSKIFGKVELPPMPKVGARLLQLMRDDEVDVRTLSRLIASEAALSAKILRTVNSSQFGLRNKVTDVQQGVTLLGLKRIESLILAFVTMQTLPKKVAGFDRAAFWQESIQQAVFAHAVAGRIARGEEGEAFTGALLQNMALPILLSQWANHYRPLVELSQATNRPLSQIEDEQLSWNHAEAGAWMARHWGFPDVLVCCIGLHHSSRAELENLKLLDTPVAATAVSSHLANAEDCCRELQIDVGQYQELCRSTDNACGELAAIFEIPAPNPLTTQT